MVETFVGLCVGFGLCMAAHAWAIILSPRRLWRVKPGQIWLVNQKVVFVRDVGHHEVFYSDVRRAQEERSSEMFYGDFSEQEQGSGGPIRRSSKSPSRDLGSALVGTGFPYDRRDMTRQLLTDERSAREQTQDVETRSTGWVPLIEHIEVKDEVEVLKKRLIEEKRSAEALLARVINPVVAALRQGKTSPHHRRRFAKDRAVPSMLDVSTRPLVRSRCCTHPGRYPSLER